MYYIFSTMIAIPLSKKNTFVVTLSPRQKTHKIVLRKAIKLNFTIIITPMKMMAVAQQRNRLNILSHVKPEKYHNYNRVVDMLWIDTPQFAGLFENQWMQLGVPIIISPPHGCNLLISLSDLQHSSSELIVLKMWLSMSRTFSELKNSEH